MRRIMVTGVGAIIGYGLLRSFRSVNADTFLIGADIYPDAVGQAWCDEFEQAPLTSDPNYLDWLEKVVKKHQVDLLIPGIEQDVHAFSAAHTQIANFGCKVAINSERLISLSQDKWSMYEELAAIDDPARIHSTLAGDFDTLASDLGLPFILKPRRGYASKGLVRITSREQFTQHAGQLGDVLMAQPIVGSDDEEYTVAIFGDGTGRICASINLQRRLAADGSTAKAWVKQDRTLDETVARLCAHFKPIGPTNLQFRKVGDAWKLLEINPRVSSTTSLRAAFGYNEAIMCVEYFVEGREIAQPVLRNGYAVRYIEDHIVYDRNHL